MAVYMVVIGPPGAGKGTQAIKLSVALQLAHLSTGELFRENIRAGTELGERVNVMLSSGALVPDELTIALVRARLQQSDCEGGAVLDGFPRTLAQAHALDEMLGENGKRVVLASYLRVSDEMILERLTSRRVDVSTGKIYHLRHNPPPLGVKVEQRLDDSKATVRLRIAEYYKSTAPLVAHYTDKGVLHEFDGEQPIEVLTDQLLNVIEARVM